MRFYFDFFVRAGKYALALARIVRVETIYELVVVLVDHLASLINEK